MAPYKYANFPTFVLIGLKGVNQEMVSTTMEQQKSKSIVLPPISSILNNPIPPLTITSTPRKPNDYHPIFANTPLNNNKSLRSNSFTLPLPTPMGKGLNGLSSSFFQSKQKQINIFSTPLPQMVLPPTPKSLSTGNINRVNFNSNDFGELDANTSTLSNSSFQSIGSPISNTKLQKRKSETFAFISHNQDTFLSSEPSIDNAQLARRKRRKTSPGEVKILIDEFSKDTTPDRKSRDRIASMLNMTEKEVQIWFQNRRQAVKRTAKRNKDEDGILKLNEKFNSSTDSFVSEDDYPPSGVFTNENKRQDSLLQLQQSQQSNSNGGQMFKFKTTANGLVSPTKSKRKQKPTMKLKFKESNNFRGPLVDITNIQNGQRILSGL